MDELAFYATPGPMTAIDEDPGLPGDDAALCAIGRGLIVHEFLADLYGVPDVDARREEVELRSAAEMLARIRALDPRPLTEPRPPERRMIGNCRHFTVLTVALLRRAGIPARARAGFAGYLGEGWTDHWVVERWDAGAGRWKRTDAQIDDRQAELFKLDFDPYDLPEDAFLSGGEAWLRCRGGEADPGRFGLAEMRGRWFVAGNVVRDLAALNKVELLPWDVWGIVDLTLGEDGDERVALVDEIAAAGDLDSWRRLYERDGIEVGGTVRSHRFQRDVRLG
jgi:hypothetical protein